MIPLRDTQPSYTTPIVTIGLILANIAAFFYEVSLDQFSLNHLLSERGIISAHFQAVDLFTSMFLHGGWMHLIGNMWFLWIYGDNVEDILGHARYLVFYLLCGVAAGMVHVLFNPGARVPTIGASGAIAGVMGAYMAKFPHSKILTVIPLIVFFTTAEIPAVFILAYWFLIQIFSGVGEIGHSAASRGSGGVAWFAHVGGFIAGYVLIRLMPTHDRYRHRPDFNW